MQEQSLVGRRWRWWLLGGVALLALLSMGMAFDCSPTGPKQTEQRSLYFYWCYDAQHALCSWNSILWHGYRIGSGHGHVNTESGDGILNGAKSAHLHTYEQAISIDNWFNPNGNEWINFNLVAEWYTDIYRSVPQGFLFTYEQNARIADPPHSTWPPIPFFAWNTPCQPAYWSNVPIDMTHSLIFNVCWQGWSPGIQLGPKGGYGQATWGITVAGGNVIVPDWDDINRTWWMHCPACAAAH
ncbi:MAG: hypothetical protein WBD55_06520 [Dehalococcoidia bacterium]